MIQRTRLALLIILVLVALDWSNNISNGGIAQVVNETADIGHCVFRTKPAGRFGAFRRP